MTQITDEEMAALKQALQPYEECILKAHHTGDGWLLWVEDRQGKNIGYLAWPKNWPENISRIELEGCGFEIEP